MKKDIDIQLCKIESKNPTYGTVTALWSGRGSIFLYRRRSHGSLKENKTNNQEHFHRPLFNDIEVQSTLKVGEMQFITNLRENRAAQ